MENNRIDLCAPEGETPIYDQIRQELAGRIRAGSLPDGTRLPTVRELSEQLHVAEGTVKRAYDELERDGLLIKTPGRGSFVCYHRTADRGQAAQEQIDALLQQLHQMGISVHEMKQLFADQLRRFCAQQPKLQVALVECNPEVLAQLKEQLRHMDGIELHTLLLEQVQQHPGRLAQQMDVMITTTEHAKQLAGMTGQAEKVAKIALRLQASGAHRHSRTCRPEYRCKGSNPTRRNNRSPQPKPALRRAAAQLLRRIYAGASNRRTGAF